MSMRIDSEAKLDVTNAANNNNVGKRKKSRRNRGAYLSKWLDKTLHHIQDMTPNVETYDPFLNPVNWPNGNQPGSGYDCRLNMYGYMSEPMSLPTLPSYCNSMTPYYNSDCRYMQNVHHNNQVNRRQRTETKAEEVRSPTGTPNCSLPHSNYFQPKNFTDNQDFASLPPIVTSVGDTASNSDMNTNDKDENVNRRYSDPCVQGLPDIKDQTNGDVHSVSDESSDASGSQVGSKLLVCLLDQITSLKIANEKLNKDLQDTRAELQNIRHQSSIWQKGPNPNMGLNYPHLNNNGLLGGHQYAPGLLTDLVREIRDAARMREEALYSRVRSMVIERSDNGLTSPDSKFSDKALEEIKSSLRASEADKRRMMDRIVKLEDELRMLRIAKGLQSTDNSLVNGNLEDSDVERLRLRKELADMRKAKQTAEEQVHKLERLVTQLRSKFNGVQISTNGPESLASEPEHGDASARARRTSTNSTSNSTVVFGPVTDL